MESTSTVIAHGVHMLTVSLSQAGTAKTEKPFVRYTANFWHFSSFKYLTKFISLEGVLFYNFKGTIINGTP